MNKKTLEQLQKVEEQIALKYLESISKAPKVTKVPTRTPEQPEPKAEPPPKQKLKPQNKLHYFIFLPVITTFIILATPPNWYN